jgi:hypothetical protein
MGVLTDCKSSDPARRPPPIEVTVPVPTPAPSIPVPERPALPIAGIDSTASPRRVAKTYARSVILLQGYARQLETLVQAYQDSTRGSHVEGRP